jgi:peptidyl-prolyl cis-trans isomerase SurA
MKRNWLLVIVLLFITFSASSQTLFTYGTYKVDTTEFIRAFKKNNQLPETEKAKAIKEYLELYINSRLKIRQAYDLGFDTLPAIKSEVENLRSQIVDAYMTDPDAINRLAKEAFERSQKDIHAAYIFIAAAPGRDSMIAFQKLNTVLKRLEEDENFLTVAQQMSDDPAAKINKGSLNYITVFTLPYEFENVIYSTPAGQYSKPLRTEKGYFIFKNIEERKALGKIKIQHILLAFPPGTDDAGRKHIQQLADSLYDRIIAGDDFGQLAIAFSNDNISAASNGNVPDIAVGQFEPAFEKMIWSLPEDGALTKPFATEYGYHIVKRVSVKPVVTDPDDKQNMEELQDRVMRDDRWKTAKDFIYTRVREKADFQKFVYSDPILWALSDSLLDGRPAGMGRAMSLSSPLFKIGDETFNVESWINFAHGNRYKRDGSGLKAYPALMDEFVKASMYQYYRDHLEDMNDEFRMQMNDFKEGNLFFEIMQREVWNKTQSDSTELKKLFEKNKVKYNWGPGADAVIFYCIDEDAAKSIFESIKLNPSDWKKIAEAMNEKVTADSGRFEWSQIPGIENNTAEPGTLTKLTINPGDNSATFAYIIKVHTTPAPRSFEEAKGLVMNDYLPILEEEWTKSLRKKYPVKVDQKMLEIISK